MKLQEAADVQKEVAGIKDAMSPGEIGTMMKTMNSYDDGRCLESNRA
jgi:hypothetical protein